ncbi:hypothetical protein MTR67_041269 [Solanum verrucosum]|uniref:PRA1 family protein n=1 Tax=Solanum verrucosum TaxID=315347 RepID=A0AAF0ZSZ5_SOLVR|nr:hypothetical protein MTR67_041269 [Solanum verrucosum]
MSSPPPDAGTVAAVAVRPWPLFIDIAALSLPISVSDATYRINKNLRYFAGLRKIRRIRRMVLCYRRVREEIILSFEFHD